MTEFVRPPLPRSLSAERRRDPVLQLPGVGWDGILAPSRLTDGANVKAGGGETGRGTERMSEGSARTEIERRLIEKSLQDESFRRRLMEDPKGAVEEELGTRLPKEVRVVAVEETADTIYLVLPGTPMADRESEALSDRELESVAGGALGDWIGYATLNNADGC